MPLRRTDSPFYTTPSVPVHASLLEVRSPRKQIILKPTLNYDTYGKKDMYMSGDWYLNVDRRMPYYDEDLL
jgi:hypothetical protein